MSWTQSVWFHPLRGTVCVVPFVNDGNTRHKRLQALARACEGITSFVLNTDNWLRRAFARETITPVNRTWVIVRTIVAGKRWRTGWRQQRHSCRRRGGTLNNLVNHFNDTFAKLLLQRINGLLKRLLEFLFGRAGERCTHLTCCRLVQWTRFVSTKHDCHVTAAGTLPQVVGNTGKK